MGYVGTALVRRQPAASPALLRASLSGLKRRAPTTFRGLGGPLTITITHGGLGSLGGAQQLSFTDAIVAAGEACASLSVTANILKTMGTTPQEVEVGRLAYRMATVTAPAGILSAQASQDLGRLQRIQDSIKGVTAEAKDELEDAVVQRFIYAVIAPPLAFMSADQLDAGKEAVNAALDKVLPKPPQDQPWYYWAGGGVTLGALGAFTLLGTPRSLVSGSIGGALLGLLARYGLQKLAEKFTL